MFQEGFDTIFLADRAADKRQRMSLGIWCTFSCPLAGGRRERPPQPSLTETPFY